MAFGFLLVLLLLCLRAALVHQGQGRPTTDMAPFAFDTAAACLGLAAFGLAAMAFGIPGGQGLLPARVLAAGFVLVLCAPAITLVTDLLPRALASSDLTHAASGGRHRLTSAVAATVKPFVALQRLALRQARRRSAEPPLTLAEGLRALLHPGEIEEASMSERHVVRRLLDFAATSVGEVMVPLSMIYAVRDDAPVSAAIDIVRIQAFSRLPVYHERMFNIVGIIHAFDLLAQEHLDQPVSKIMRPPLYVPQTKRARDLLSQLQKLGINMAVVVDEHGGAVGIVTVEDLLEEIVGEIEDEYDVREEPCERLSERLFRVEAKTEVIHLNERFGWGLPTGDYETIGGLIITRLGRIPKKGEWIDLGRVSLQVADADARCVKQVLVRLNT